MRRKIAVMISGTRLGCRIVGAVISSFGESSDGGSLANSIGSQDHLGNRGLRCDAGARLGGRMDRCGDLSLHVVGDSFKLVPAGIY